MPAPKANKDDVAIAPEAATVELGVLGMTCAACDAAHREGRQGRARRARCSGQPRHASRDRDDRAGRRHDGEARLGDRGGRLRARPRRGRSGERHRSGRGAGRGDPGLRGSRAARAPARFRLRDGAPDGSCPVGAHGAVCNTGFFAEKAHVCLYGRCVEQKDCPEGARCLTTIGVLGYCSNGDPGSVCVTKDDCKQRECWSAGAGFGICL